MTKDKKLSNEQIRKQNLLRTWGIEDGPHNPNFRNIIRNAVDEADAEKKKADQEKEFSKTIPIDVDSITKRRLEYEHNNNFEEPEKGIGELLNTRESNND